MTTLWLLLFGIVIGVGFTTLFCLLSIVPRPKRDPRNRFLRPPAPRLTLDAAHYRREREAWHRMTGPKPANGHQRHP